MCLGVCVPLNALVSRCKFGCARECIFMCVCVMCPKGNISSPAWERDH